MVPKYWPIQRVSRELQVPAPTLRRWIENGSVHAYRLADGGHRRVPYEEVARLAKELGQGQLAAASEIRPDHTYRLEEAAEYLGVSSRFLWNQRLSLSQGGQVTGSDVLAWEALLYSDETEDIGETDSFGLEGDGEMSGYGMHRHGPGPRGGGFGWGPRHMDWDEEDHRAHSALWLRSMKRHLEARKADIEDRLNWVEEQLRKSEDKSHE
ncbi:MAG: excisionase [Sulfobacillus acidophilus]|uniref:Excisionase n=1 Tax=Sulfobacillus acidophilus TaxID=53633 RepID=A0A2T2WKQ8_9FIRM|nr:MAG: excisionase [Sulfobacillus acidophilus]